MIFKILLKKYKNVKCVLCLLSLIYFINIKSINAKSVGESMGEFWNDIGGSFSNSSEAGGYQLQGSG